MEKIVEISDIDISIKEGRYLMAALVKLTTESQTDKTPFEVLDQCYELQLEMFKQPL